MSDNPTPNGHDFHAALGQDEPTTDNQFRTEGVPASQMNTQQRTAAELNNCRETLIRAAEALHLVEQRLAYEASAAAITSMSEDISYSPLHNRVKRALTAIQMYDNTYGLRPGEDTSA